MADIETTKNNNSMATPQDVRLRGQEFKTAKCAYCRYFPDGEPPQGLCDVLDIDVKDVQVCDAYQGKEDGAEEPYAVSDEDKIAFVNGMVKIQPYQHIVIKPIKTPIGILILIKDTAKPKPHFFSLDFDFHIQHTTVEHAWSQEEADKLIQIGKIAPVRKVNGRPEGLLAKRKLEQSLESAELISVQVSTHKRG